MAARSLPRCHCDILLRLRLTHDKSNHSHLQEAACQVKAVLVTTDGNSSFYSLTSFCLSDIQDGYDGDYSYLTCFASLHFFFFTAARFAESVAMKDASTFFIIYHNLSYVQRRCIVFVALTSPDDRTLFMYSRKDSSLISLSVKMKLAPLPCWPLVLYRFFRSSIRLAVLYDLVQDGAQGGFALTLSF